MLPNCDVVGDIIYPIAAKLVTDLNLEDDLDRIRLQDYCQEYVKINWVTKTVKVEYHPWGIDPVALKEQVESLLWGWVRDRRLKLVELVEKAVSKMDKWNVTPKKLYLPRPWFQISGSDFLGMTVFQGVEARIETSPGEGRFVLV